jgi:hypothetical protein
MYSHAFMETDISYMETTEARHLKGVVHLLLAAAPLLELKQSSTKLRNVLCGLAAGWHLNAAFYHFFIEKGAKHGRKIPRKAVYTK